MEDGFSDLDGCVEGDSLSLQVSGGGNSIANSGDYTVSLVIFAISLKAPAPGVL